MPPAAPPSRLESRIAMLGGPSTKTILVAVGDSVRRPSDAKSARPEETERALSALSCRDVCEALAAADTTTCLAALHRAAEDAFEASFADTQEDRTLFASAALDGLATRDRLASMEAAARRKLELLMNGGGNRAEASELEAALGALATRLQEVDGGRASLARRLTGINAERRAELGRLAPEMAERAWWYAARIEDDALLSVLGGEALPEGASAGLRADLARSSQALALGAGGRGD
ncbi:MAG: hypothetical protein JNL21_35985 [Myxococcales bacterium]|nr:hypothetical protein [Myxococcales bacterium]